MPSLIENIQILKKDCKNYREMMQFYEESKGFKMMFCNKKLITGNI